MAKAKKTQTKRKSPPAKGRAKAKAPRKKAAKKRKATAEDEPRELKDRLLQTRITPSLYEQVVARARDLKIPVSNLIRIVLEDSVKLVDGVVDESLNIADILSDREPRSRSPRPAAPPASAAPAAAVTPDEAPVAWQAVVVGRRAVCGDCGRPLFPAESAHLGLGADGRPVLFACADCYAKEIAAARGGDEPA